jgi:surface protein
MYLAFYRMIYLTINATDTPNLRNVINMQQMFDATTNLTGNFSGWDTSNVQNMSYLWRSATNFNQPLNSWDTTNVTTMAYLFQNASKFNQPLDSWNVSKVTTMQEMFNGANSFNQDLSSWTPIALPASSTTALSNALLNTNLSTYNYNALLSSRSQLTGLKNGLNPLHVSPTQYGGCPDRVSNALDGIAGRTKLTSGVAQGGKARVISDGGMAP